MGDIKLGSSAISTLKFGNLNVSAAYFGSNKIYPPIRTFLVRFFDIDGTLLSSQNVIKGGNATAPSTISNYDPSNLTFLSWNNTFTNVQSDIDVGWCGKTTDSKAHIVTKSLAANTTITLRFKKGTNDTATIEWGDAQTSTTSIIGNSVMNHTYTTAGVKRIKVSVVNNGILVFGLLSTTGGRIFEPATMIKSFHQGHPNVYVGTGGFYYPSTDMLIEVASLYEGAVVNHSIFKRTSAGGALKWFNFPTNCTNTDSGQTQQFVNQSTNFRGFVLNGSYDVIGINMLSGTTDIQTIILPASITKINSVVTPSTTTKLICKATTPPILSGTGLINATCTIYVPDDSVATYKSATYWSANASQIFGFSDLP